jgi:hypothetical protein
MAWTINGLKIAEMAAIGHFVDSIHRSIRPLATGFSCNME